MKTAERWRALHSLEMVLCDAEGCLRWAAFHNTETGKRYCVVDAYRRRKP